jgi:hypothetical protein
VGAVGNPPSNIPGNSAAARRPALARNASDVDLGAATLSVAVTNRRIP